MGPCRVEFAGGEAHGNGPPPRAAKARTVFSTCQSILSVKTAMRGVVMDVVVRAPGTLLRERAIRPALPGPLPVNGERVCPDIPLSPFTGRGPG